ncbi:MAG TPA: VWA domain-containing protein [Blastocatellia bacterium]|nr:VWA domain-containing protein [Blastocatellia bacterium]
MRKQFLSLAFSVVVLLACSFCLPAQTPRPRTVAPAAEQKKTVTQPPDQTPAEPAISVDTTEVLLPVTVRDRTGRFVPDLRSQDFVIYEDDVPQQITSFALRRLPVHVLLMIDTSSSVQRELDDFKAAALRFAEKLNEADSLSLIRFDDKVELVMDWTASRAALKRALNRLGTGMFTKFNDAMYLAAHEQLSRIRGRKAIIVFTDGVDSGRGSKSAEAALRALVEAEAPVYIISKTRMQRRASLQELDYYENSPASSRTVNQTRIDGLRLSLEALEESERNLTRLAEETGGRLFLPQRFENLDDAYQEVADELQNQYVIFYTPGDTRRDGRYRRTRVRISRPSCYATTRFGYYLR